MATEIKLKKSSVPGRIPSAGDLSYGEIAINYADGIIYFKNSSDEVKSISASAVGIDSAATIGLIDSAYVLARAGDAGLDSADVIALVGDGTFRGLRSYSYTADSGDATFSGADDNGNSLVYTSSSVMVVVNGIVLRETDYTATNGTSVTLNTAADSGDEITIFNVVAGGTDSALIRQEVESVVDSAYVLARAGDAGLDSTAVLNLIDSSHVQSQLGTLRESNGTLLVSGHILPSTDSTYSIGSEDKKFKDIFLSGGTVYIDNLGLSADPQTQTISIGQLDSAGILTTLGVIATVDSAGVEQIVDSAYLASKLQAYVTDTELAAFGYSTFDSTNATNLVDSSYVQARQTAQDFAYSSLTGAPNVLDSTNVSNIVTDFGYTTFDSAAAIALITANAIDSSVALELLLDSIETINLIDSAYVQARQTDFAELTDLSVTTAGVASGGGSLNYNTSTGVFTFTPASIPSVLDSDDVTDIVDSAYVQARQDFAYSSLTGIPTTVDSGQTSTLINQAFADRAGVTNEIMVVDSTGNDFTTTDILTIDATTNRVGINQTSPEVTLHMTGEAAQTAQIRMEQHHDGSDAPDIRTRKSRGTAATPSKNSAGDFIYRQNHERYNGSAYVTVGQLAIDADGTNADRFKLTLAVSEDGGSIDAAQHQFAIDGANSGAITFNQAYTFPTADGSANQVLQTDGSGTLTFVDQSGGLDSAGVTGIVDSAYVQARQTPQDFAYSSLTGAPNVLDSADITSITSTLDSAVLNNPTLNSPVFGTGDSSPYFTEIRFNNSNIMKFNQMYTGAANGTYFTNGEYQKVATITPSANSENYQVVGRITAQNAADIHTVYFNAGLRSVTLPDLTWSVTYNEEYNNTRYIDPQLWTKETTTAGFIFAFKTLATIYGTVTVDFEVIPRSNTLLNNVVVNSVQNSEQTTVDAGFTARDMTRTHAVIGNNVRLGEFTFPVADGDANQVLGTNGSGTLQFINQSSGLDSSGVTGIIDSSYVQARQTAQDFAYSSLTGAPTVLDSANVDALIDSAFTNTPVTFDQTVTAAASGNSFIINDTLRIDSAGSGLRLTNIGAFDRIPSTSNFRIFSNNDLVFATNGSSGTVLTLDKETKDATFEGAIIVNGDSVTLYDSTTVSNFVDSSYVQARQTAQDFAYSSLTGAPNVLDSANVSSIVTDFGYTTFDSTAAIALITANAIDSSVALELLLDSIETINLIDSAYVQARQTTQDFAYSSLTGAPNVLDSADVALIAQANDTTKDSAFVTGLIDSAYINARVTASSGTDSATVITLVTDTVDSAYVLARANSVGRVSVNETTIIADSGQTTFNASYVEGAVQVYLNGILLSNGLDYTATSGSSVVLTLAADSGDALVINSIGGDSARIENVVDSAYINARTSAGTDSATVVTIVESTVDSAYVQARQTAQDFAYSSLTGVPNVLDSTNVSNIVTDFGYTTFDSTAAIALITSNAIDSSVALELLLDSIETINLIDSAYVQARQTAQDFAYSSLTGAPNVLDSANVVSLITANDQQRDSAFVTGIIDSAYITARETAQDFAYSSLTGAPNVLDSTNVSNIVTGFGYTTFDSTAAIALITANAIDSSVALELLLDSIETINLIDSAYVQARQTAQDFAYSSLTGAPNVLDSTDVTNHITGSDLDMAGNKVLFGNVYDSVGALPSASTYHGMFAHVHATGAGYFAHAGSWVQLANNSDISTYGNSDVESLVDSAYVQARQSTVGSGGLDSAAVTNLVDSAYVQARQTSGGGGGLDSAAVLNLVPEGSARGLFAYYYTADSGDTTFSGADDNGTTLAYSEGSIAVYLNGLLLRDIDYTANNGTSVVLGEAVDSGDEITILKTNVSAADSDTIADLIPAATYRGVRRFEYSADSGQTSFTGSDVNGNTLSFSSLNILVAVNGIILREADYTTTGTTTVTLVDGADSGDEVTVYNITAGGIDSTATIDLIDSAYISARSSAGTDSATVVTIVESTADSAYVQARQTAQDFAYSSLTGAPNVLDSTNVSNIVTGFGYTTFDSTAAITLITANAIDSSVALELLLDSIETINLIDSAYVQARQTAQDFAYSSLTGTPTVLDSGDVTNIIDSAYVQARETAQDFAYSSLTGTPTVLDSANVISLITANDQQRDSSFVTGIIDSAYITDRETAQDFAYSSLTGAPNVLDSTNVSNIVTDFGYTTFDSAAAITLITANAIDSSVALELLLDSIETINLIDSAYVQARQTAQDFAYSSLTGAPTVLDSANVISLITANDQQRDSAFITGLIDSDFIETRRPAEATFNVVSNGASAYTFTGDGFTSGRDNPTLYLQRGLTYKFSVSASGHPFQIRLSDGGSAYNTGVTNNGVQSGNLIFTPDMNAPNTLVYQCTVHSGMVGDIVIIDNATFLDSSEATTLITSYGYSTFDSTNATALITSYGYTTYDSTDTLGLIDSAYIQARQSNVGSGGLDSSAVTNLVDSAYVQARQSSVGSGGLDSAAALTLLEDRSVRGIYAYYYTADSGDTTFSGADSDGNTLSYTTGSIAVYLNGVLLRSTDYTATNGTSVVLDEALLADDEVTIIKSIAGGSVVTNNFVYTADSGDTIFSGADDKGITLQYAVGNVQVYRNGILLVDSDDYTASNGTSITLTNDANASDNISIVSFTGSADGVDSATAVTIVESTVDSAYVQARQTDQDFAYSSLTGAPTVLDSTDITNLIDSAYVQARQTSGGGGLDSAEVLGIVDSAYVQARVDDNKYLQLNQIGTLEVTTGTARWVSPRNINISTVKAIVGTAPVGSSLITTLNKNGSAIDTLTIAAGSDSDTNTGLSLSVSQSDYLTVDITQIGSTTAGSDLNVIITYVEE